MCVCVCVCVCVYVCEREYIQLKRTAENAPGCEQNRVNVSPVRHPNWIEQEKKEEVCCVLKERSRCTVAGNSCFTAVNHIVVVLILPENQC